MVLIHEDNTPPQKWHLRRVTRVIAGDDRKIRVAEAQASTGIVKRAIHKLAPIPWIKEPQSFNGGGMLERCSFN